jgi:predicted DNA-binding transcriptional regulator YafY
MSNRDDDDEGDKWEPAEFPRYWLLMETLQREPQYKTARELQQVLKHEGHDVSDRTVQRILEYFGRRFALKSRKRPGQPGAPNEWAWPKTRGAPTIGDMDPPTALTYELAAKLLALVLPESILRGMERDFQRARKALGQVGRKAKTLTGKVRVLPRARGRQPAQINPDVLLALYDALFQNKRVQVQYLSQSRNPPSVGDYQLSPLAIVSRIDTLYLVHVLQPRNPDKDPDTVMEWPLHRFKKVTILDTPARVPPTFNLDEHLRHAGFERNRHLEKLRDIGPEFKLVALFRKETARYVQERPFNDDQTGKDTKDGRVRIEATVQNTRELLTALHDFAADVEIIAPKQLRNYFKGLSESLYERYHQKGRAARA